MRPARRAIAADHEPFDVRLTIKVVQAALDALQQRHLGMKVRQHGAGATTVTWMASLSEGRPVCGSIR